MNLLYSTVVCKFLRLILLNEELQCLSYFHFFLLKFIKKNKLKQRHSECIIEINTTYFDFLKDLQVKGFVYK